VIEGALKVSLKNVLAASLKLVRLKSLGVTNNWTTTFNRKKRRAIIHMNDVIITDNVSDRELLTILCHMAKAFGEMTGRHITSIQNNTERDLLTEYVFFFTESKDVRPCAVVRALAFYQCVPGSIPGPRGPFLESPEKFSGP